MFKFVRKAGALGAAATCCALIFGAETTGAFAQAPDAIELTIAGPDELPALPDDMPEFVSEPVVQDVPEVAEDEVEQARAAVTAASLNELVAKTDTSESMSEQLRCLASAVYFEARGEPLAGQLAVAKVIMNRANSRQFPSSYCGVVKQRSQFSFVKGGNIPAPRKGTTAWNRAKAIARIAHNDTWDSAVQDSLYFHATYVKPGWARKKVARATIQTHVFYK